MNKKLNARTVNSLITTGQRYRVWDTEIKGFNVRVTPKGKKIYIFTYRHNGVQKEYTIGRHGDITADIARDLSKKQAGLVADGKDVQAERVKAKQLGKSAQFSTLQKFLTHKYQPWVEANQKGHKESLRTINVDFAHLHGRKMAEISQWDIQKWMAEARKNGLKPTTINRRVATLKAVLSKAAEWSVIENSPLAGMKRLKTDNNSSVRYLSKDEENSLRAALDARQDTQRAERLKYIQWRNTRHLSPPHQLSDPFTDHLKPITLIALNTGMRRGELFKLSWPDINLTGRLFTVQGDVSKSGQTRHIPMNDEAFSTITTWRNQTTNDDLVFPSPVTGQKLDNINSSWKKLIADSGIAKFRFHDLRHHFASHLVMRGVDLNTVRELLGHRDIKTTLRYAHLAPEHKAAAVALLNHSVQKILPNAG